MYENIRDAEFRLKNTVVFYNNSYRLVQEVLKEGGSIVLKLSQKDQVVTLSNKNLKVRSIPTGYNRVGGSVVFLSRMPKRRYRQGLRSDNCLVWIEHERVRFEDFVILLLRKKRDRVPEGDKIKLLNRDFIIDNKEQVGRIFYRRRLVGYYQDNKAYFTNGFDFIKEAFDKAMEEYNG